MDKLKQALLPELGHRARQLETEQELDRQLAMLPCDKIIRDYYAFYRAWNREMYRETISDLWNYRCLTNKGLQAVDEHQQELRKILLVHPPLKACAEISALIKN